MSLYASRQREQRELRRALTRASGDPGPTRHLEAIGCDHMRELTYRDRKALHNLKYYTWVEQQGRTVDELRSAVGPRLLGGDVLAHAEVWDRQIERFNAM
jgi:cysteine synthase A